MSQRRGLQRPPRHGRFNWTEFTQPPATAAVRSQNPSVGADAFTCSPPHSPEFASYTSPLGPFQIKFENTCRKLAVSWRAGVLLHMPPSMPPGPRVRRFCRSNSIHFQRSSRRFRSTENRHGLFMNPGLPCRRARAAARQVRRPVDMATGRGQVGPRAHPPPMWGWGIHHFSCTATLLLRAPRGISGMPGGSGAGRHVDPRYTPTPTLPRF